MKKQNEQLIKKFEVVELEQRLEMAKWTAKASSSQTFDKGGFKQTYTQEIGCTWGK